MRTLLYTTVLCSAFLVSPGGAFAKDLKMEAEEPSFIIKASYSLPKKDGDEFRRTLHEADEESLQSRQQIGRDYGDIYNLMTAQDFDKKTFLAKLVELRRLQDQVKENRDDAFTSATAQLTLEERTTLANALEKSVTHGAPHYRHQKTVVSDAINKTPADDGSKATPH